MGIRVVAVGTGIVGDSGLEVAIAMAGFATGLQVFTKQRILRLGVIELCCETTPLPRRGTVAGFTALLELSAMRIVVAGGAAIEFQAGKFRHTRGIWKVTLLARCLPMLSREDELRFGVVEVARVLPILRVMTLRAVGAELALVLVLMAACATWRQSEIGAGWVLHLEAGSLRLLDIRRVMTFVAGQTRVFSVECEAGLAVIELRGRRIPVQQAKRDPVVFGVTAHACSFWFRHKYGM